MTATPGGTTHRRTLRWQAAKVLDVRDETANARSYLLRLPEPRRHLAGQHYVLRLTAPDGYSASRSYSVASPPDDTGEIELTVERLVDGEVSEFVHDVVAPGDELEVRGPIGGFFVWRGDTRALLIGGGSGVVPLMAMLRQGRRDGTPTCCGCWCRRGPPRTSTTRPSCPATACGSCGRGWRRPATRAGPAG